MASCRTSRKLWSSGQTSLSCLKLRTFSRSDGCERVGWGGSLNPELDPKLNPKPYALNLKQCESRNPKPSCAKSETSILGLGPLGDSPS